MGNWLTSLDWAERAAKAERERDEARQRAERAEAIVDRVRDIRDRMWEAWFEESGERFGVGDWYEKAPQLLKDLDTAMTTLPDALAADPQPAEAGALAARERELREALEKLYLETDRPYAVYGDPALSTMEQLVRFENARIEAARVIGLERIKALLAQPAAGEEREHG